MIRNARNIPDGECVRVRQLNAAPRKSLVDHVETELRAALIEGRLEPGTRLVTKELATSLGVSITPVREALVRFAASGILTAEPAQSFRVPRLTVERHEELVVIRKAVEGLAAEHATRRITDADINRLEVLLEKYLDAKNSRDHHRALVKNRAFRFALYQAADMPTLMQVIENLWLRTGPGFNYLYPEDDAFQSRHENYDTLLTALRNRSAEGARAAIEQAIDDGAKRVTEALAKASGDGVLAP